MGAAKGMTTPVLPSKVERWPIGKVRGYERNSRIHGTAQVDAIATSILEFGFTNPLLVEPGGELIAGHGRLAAAQKLGLEEVPVIVLQHLTPAQRRAYVIADNKLAEGSAWNTDLLAAELDALQVDGFNLDLLGFDADELGDLLGSGEFEGAEDEEKDEVDEGPNRGIALAIVLTPEEMLQWRRAKAELGYSTDKAAFWKLVEDVLEEVE